MVQVMKDILVLFIKEQLVKKNEMSSREVNMYKAI